MPMGIVTAMATAIVVTVTGVNCVEVMHTKAILGYDDTMMRYRDGACTEIGGQLKRWYWPWCRTYAADPTLRKGVVATVTALAA